MLELKKTPFYKFHEEFGRIGEFAGYAMPLWYSSPSIEHLSVRRKVGLFDVSHMGRILVEGRQAEELLSKLLTNDCRKLEVQKSHISIVCNVKGGIKDDVMVLRLKRGSFLLTVNAANKEKDLSWFRRFKGDMDVKLVDLTSSIPMIAIQGPYSINIVENLFNEEFESLRRMRSRWARSLGKPVLVSRSGYTGEDGFELYLFNGFTGRDSLNLWHNILRVGKKWGIKPCGLAARDTLRIEAGYCLYDNELNEEITPLEADLKFAVKLDDRDFIGKEALERQVKEGVSKIRVGFKLLERGIPRKGMDIFCNGVKTGKVTSGTFSPLLKIGIGMGYLPPKLSDQGRIINVNIRGRLVKAEIVKFPFYDVKVYGWKRSVET